MSDGVSFYHGGCEGFTCRALAELLSIVSSFHPWPSRWTGEGFAKSRGGRGARTRGRARLGWTRRKENSAVHSPATVFILVS